MNQPVVASPDPAQIIKLLWEARWRIILVALLFGALGATYALLATPIYRAQVVLLPVQTKGASGLPGQLGALSGLAGLAGINIGGVDKAEPLAVLSSHDFSRGFIEANGLVPVLLAEKWDPVKKNWKKPGPNQPDIRDAVEYFDKDVRRVGEDKKTGVVVVSLDWTSPTQAAEWANSLASLINSQMRARAIADAERSISYLRAELDATNQVSLQQSISKLIESQMQTMMVARGNEEYAFRVIDSARVPKKRLSPKRTLITVGAAMIGGFLACAWVMMFPRRPSA
jgi:uncharacterized protein involved in exopolysaccharide biosynthesis